MCVGQGVPACIGTGILGTRRPGAQPSTRPSVPACTPQTPPPQPAQTTGGREPVRCVLRPWPLPFHLATSPDDLVLAVRIHKGITRAPVVQGNAALAKAYALRTPLRVVLAKARKRPDDSRVYVYDGLYMIIECHKCGSLASFDSSPAV